MRRIAAIVIFIVGGLLNGHSQKPIENLDLETMHQISEECIKTHGCIIDVDDSLMPFFSTSLSYYPELINTPIKVKTRNIKTTMRCRPRIGFLFKKKENRRYILVVDTKTNNNNGILFESLPINAKVGIIGHELAHIIDYSDKSNFQILKMGIDYLNEEKKREIEEYIDFLTISYGLGYQLDDFACYVFNESQASEEYLNYKRKFYFQPFQIRKLMRAKSIYKENKISRKNRFDDKK